MARGVHSRGTPGRSVARAPSLTRQMNGRATTLGGTMKTLSLALLLALAAAVLWPAASYALAHGASAPPRATQLRLSPSAGSRAAAAPTGAARRASERSTAVRAATGPCTVIGRAYDFAGHPLAGIEVDLWYSATGGVWVHTDATGKFTFTRVPEAVSGELVVWPDTSGNTAFYSINDTFKAAGPNNFTLRPGMTGAEIARTSDKNWNRFTSFRLDTWGSAGGGLTIVPGDYGSGYVMAPDYDYAVAYPWVNQGIEWHASPALPVTPGSSDGLTMAFDQAKGRSTYVGAPYWASGKPGSKATVVLKNWPAGYHAGLSGISESPDGKDKVLRKPSLLRGSHQLRNVSVTIPGTATPGYDYDIHVARTDPGSALNITTYFQVASLTASPTSLRHGGAVRLSGVVPTQGHMGSTAGKSKSVILYQRTTAAGPPTTTIKGWRKVATLKANGLGKYASRLLHPKRTTWYVVLYPGDDWYWDAFTSVTKVAVK